MSDVGAIIAALRAERDSLAALVQGLSGDDLARASGAPGWDVSQVLGHLGRNAQIAVTAAEATSKPTRRDERVEALVHASESLIARYETREPSDSASAAGAWLREFALHSWDVRVAFDPHATLLPMSTELLLRETQDMALAGSAGRMGGARVLIEVTTTEPESTFALRLLEPIVVDEVADEQPDGTLALPAEAWVRLLTGRLPAEHTPAGVVTTGAADLDQLRGIFLRRCEPVAEPSASQDPVGGAEAGKPDAPRRARHWTIRWLRRLGFAALTVFATLTAFSLIFNAVTQPPPVADPGFGAYAQVGASSVHYQAWGASGTPIVLVPGFLESSTVWSEVGPLLGEHHRVYALDLPGHGYTRYTGPMLLSDQAQLVDGFVRALHLDRPVLVGHSLGAAIIGSVALTHPEDVRKVVFADGDGQKLNLGPKWLRSLIVDSPYLTTVVRMGARWTTVDKWFIRMTCGPSCATPSTTVAQQWVAPLDQGSDEHALQELMRNSDYGLTPQQLSAISVPSAIIWGSDDSQGGSLSATIANLHRPPLHVISNAGHLTMIADPHAFAQALEAES